MLQQIWRIWILSGSTGFSKHVLMNSSPQLWYRCVEEERPGVHNPRIFPMRVAGWSPSPSRIWEYLVGCSQKRLAGTVQSTVSERSGWEKSVVPQKKQGLARENCCVWPVAGEALWGTMVEQQLLLLYSVPREFFPSVPSWSGKRTPIHTLIMNLF